jgi:hypothetical protein
MGEGDDGDYDNACGGSGLIRRLTSELTPIPKVDLG